MNTVNERGMMGPNWGISDAEDAANAQDARDYAAQEAKEDEDSDANESADNELSQQADIYGSSTSWYEH